MSTLQFTTEQLERFYSKIDYSDNHPLGCHEWTASKIKNGYGHLKINGKTKLAHRCSYELAYGEIPEKLLVLHDCDNPSCCDPNHLRLGTPSDNMRDMTDRERDNPPSLGGEQHGRAKLTAEQVREIRQRYIPYDQWNGTRALAREFDVDAATISLIVNGKIWKMRD